MALMYKRIKELSKIANKAHADVNHLYDTKPYDYHLSMVFNVGMRYISLISEKDREYVLIACHTHDMIENTRWNYNDVVKTFGIRVANITYALTDEKGKNRDERKSNKLYDEMNLVRYAPFVKMCDRIANVIYSKSISSKMFKTYKKENDSFIDRLQLLGYEKMINELNNLLND